MNPLQPFLHPDVLILRLAIIFIALTVHEWAHAFVAWKCGDPTARNAGRMTLNPLSHLDLFGTLFMIFFPFGWAKPVPVNPAYFSHAKRDTVLVSLAGPASNVLLSISFGYLIFFLNRFSPAAAGSVPLQQFLAVCMDLNLGLAVFNLIPVPPLDGSNIAVSIMPRAWLPSFAQATRYVSLLLLFAVLLSCFLPNVNIIFSLIEPVLILFKKIIYVLFFSYL